MGLRFYSLSELLDAAKRIVRGDALALGTEPRTDVDLTAHAAARLLQGSQVAAQYLVDQLEPRTADAAGRDRMLTQYGMSLAHPAAPARGLLVVLTDLAAGFRVEAGTELTIPASAFFDGVSRTYRTLETIDCPGLVGGAHALATGTSIAKLRPASLSGVEGYRARDVLRVTGAGGAAHWLVVVRRVNTEDSSLDLYQPVPGAFRHSVTGESVALYTRGVVVPVEAIEAGAQGNAHPTLAHVEIAGVEDSPYVLLLEAGGGGDETGDVDVSAERMVRLLEDAMACPPSFGNAQHWREVALSCPDVDLDDVVVYQGVRGPGTIDLVAIGKSGSPRSRVFPEAHLAFVPWGANTRRIGEVAAEKLEAWCKARASYFDDLKVRSVEWDLRGNTYAESGFERFFYAINRIDVRIDAEDGYGPDAGIALDVLPHTRHASRLYPSRVGAQIDERIRPGTRIWACVAEASTVGRNAFATLVTTVEGVALDRSYVEIAPVSALVPGDPAEVFAGTDRLDLRVVRWGTAGPLTQPVLDAVFSYFDGLGPGSYLLAPKGPGYVRRFWGTGVAPPEPGLSAERWPPEGRRWSSSLRASELRAELLAITGIRAATIGELADDLIDADPALFRTLALAGVIPRYR